MKKIGFLFNFWWLFFKYILEKLFFWSNKEIHKNRLHLCLAKKIYKFLGFRDLYWQNEKNGIALRKKKYLEGEKYDKNWPFGCRNFWRKKNKRIFYQKNFPHSITFSLFKFFITKLFPTIYTFFVSNLLFLYLFWGKLGDTTEISAKKNFKNFFSKTFTRHVKLFRKS